MSRDDRLVRSAQAIEIAWAFVVLITLAVIYAIVKEVFVPMLDVYQQHSSTASLDTGLAWTATIFNNFLLGVVVVSVLGLIALAVYQSRGY
ncbi:hypothetical protein [Halarchaeum salinum]|uniref:Uncharacterized protein n=1 Tax=Halarchaeum salinum TaxID=489912 RepID=A0AAV3S7N5_9EURY